MATAQTPTEGTDFGVCIHTLAGVGHRDGAELAADGWIQVVSLPIGRVAGHVAADGRHRLRVSEVEVVGHDNVGV